MEEPMSFPLLWFFDRDGWANLRLAYLLKSSIYICCQCTHTFCVWPYIASKEVLNSLVPLRIILLWLQWMQKFRSMTLTLMVPFRKAWEEINAGYGRAAWGDNGASRRWDWWLGIGAYGWRLWRRKGDSGRDGGTRWRLVWCLPGVAGDRAANNRQSENISKTIHRGIYW
jgi:hypothetical protein